jgi:hypothetical protein
MLKLVGTDHDPLFWAEISPFFNNLQLMYSYVVPTAIVRIYTYEGFVIAADGYPTGTTQKIFPAIGPHHSLAYGLCGWANVSGEGTPWRVCWADECREIANRPAPIGNMSKYAKVFTETLGRQVTNKIAQLKENGEISDSDYFQLQTEQRDSSIHFAGYFKGAPRMAVGQIRFNLPTYSANLVRQPDYCNPDDNYLFGSGKIRNLLFSPTEPFFSDSPETLQCAKYIWKRYRTPNLVKLLERRQVSLDEAVEAATDYIEACEDPEAKRIDETACREIAGDIHIATIKPNEGFRWVPGREPSPEATITVP